MLNTISATGTAYFDPSLTAALSNTPVILYDSGFTGYTASGSDLEVISYTATADCIAFLYIMASYTGATNSAYCGARITQSGSSVQQLFQWYWLNLRGQQRKNSGSLVANRLYICTDTSETTTEPHPNYGFVLPSGGNIVGRIASQVTSGAKGHMRLICIKADPVSFLNRYAR
jgi:hypothetical protein